jgi:hypothetical protein
VTFVPILDQQYDFLPRDIPFGHDAQAMRAQALERVFLFGLVPLFALLVLRDDRGATACASGTGDGAWPGWSSPAHSSSRSSSGHGQACRLPRLLRGEPGPVPISS